MPFWQTGVFMTRIEIKQKAKQQLGSNIFSNKWLMALLVLLIVSIASGIAGSVVPALGAILITGPLTYAVAYIFLKQARDNEPMSLEHLLKGFSDCFADSFLIGLMTAIFTALWSLLFVIPGIVKAFSYSMAYYIKCDHPEYNWRQCINESTRIMNGHKMELFIQHLSFIGWYIVGSFVLGVGVLWVAPYHQAATTHFYLSIKDN